MTAVIEEFHQHRIRWPASNSQYLIEISHAAPFDLRCELGFDADSGVGTQKRWRGGGRSIKPVPLDGGGSGGLCDWRWQRIDVGGVPIPKAQARIESKGSQEGAESKNIHDLCAAHKSPPRHERSVIATSAPGQRHRQ